MKWFVLVAAAIVAAVLVYLQVYEWNFNALKREIQKHENLKIIASWRSDDLTLDDFGFTVKSAAGEFEINIFGDLSSNIRTPRDPVAGLLVMRANRPFELEVVSFGDPSWKAKNLPTIENIAGLLDHCDEVLDALAVPLPEAKTVPSQTSPAYRDHIHFVIRKKPGV